MNRWGVGLIIYSLLKMIVEEGYIGSLGSVFWCVRERRIPHHSTQQPAVLPLLRSQTAAQLKPSRTAATYRWDVLRTSSSSLGFNGSLHPWRCTTAMFWFLLFSIYISHHILLRSEHQPARLLMELWRERYNRHHSFKKRKEKNNFCISHKKCSHLNTNVPPHSI